MTTTDTRFIIALLCFTAGNTCDGAVFSSAFFYVAALCYSISSIVAGLKNK